MDRNGPWDRLRAGDIPSWLLPALEGGAFAVYRIRS
jgi:hypothetical protein